MPQVTATQVQEALDTALLTLENTATNKLIKYAIGGVKALVDETQLCLYVATALNAILAKVPA